jgi:hypothetical protein
MAGRSVRAAGTSYFPMTSLLVSLSGMSRNPVFTQNTKNAETVPFRLIGASEVITTTSHARVLPGLGVLNAVLVPRNSCAESTQFSTFSRINHLQ